MWCGVSVEVGGCAVVERGRGCFFLFVFIWEAVGVIGAGFCLISDLGVMVYF